MSCVDAVDITRVASTLPAAPVPEVPRAALEHIEQAFAGGDRLVTVDGEPGHGKTTVLAQFVRRHSRDAFCLHVTAADRASCTPEFARYELCNQIHWFLERAELDCDAAAPDLLQRLGRRLDKHARKTGMVSYFVVDGLLEVADLPAALVQEVLDVIPLRYRWARALLSGPQAPLPSGLKRLARVRPITVEPFTGPEAADFLRDLDLTSDQAEEVHRTCRGVPESLAAVRRIILSRGEPEMAIRDLPHELPRLFEIEWRPVREEPPGHQLALAVLARGPARRRCRELATICGEREEAIRQLAGRLHFVAIDPATDEVRFVSETFRCFADGRLVQLHRRADEALIQHAMGAPGSAEALDHLPEYLERAGHPEAILEFASPDTLLLAFERAGSLAAPRRMSDLAFHAASQLGNSASAAHFASLSSVIRELGRSRAWRSEVEALLALHDHEGALAVAESAYAKEDRLQLLAAIAGTYHRKGLAPDPALSERIAQLYEDTDKAHLGDQAFEIAADLLPSSPDLAISLVREATPTRAGKAGTDWAVATASVLALSRSAPSDPTATLSQLRGRVADPEVAQFLDALFLRVGRFSAAEVIAETDRMSDVSSRLLVLRTWARSNARRSDSGQVVRHALELATRSTDYAPNARDLRELAAPMPHVGDPDLARELVRSFDMFGLSAKTAGPTEEYTRLQLALARAEMRYDAEAAQRRLDEQYLETSYLADLGTKAGCLARQLALLSVPDAERSLEKGSDLRRTVEEELEECLPQLLAASAEHYDVTRSVVRALARSRRDMVTRLVGQLNTEERRDRARRELLQVVASRPLSDTDVEFASSQLDEFAQPSQRDAAYMAVLESVCTTEGDSAAVTGAQLRYVGLADSVTDLAERCRAYCLAFSLLALRGDPAHEGFRSSLLQKLHRTLGAMDAAWEAVDVGFKVARSLAEVAPEVARDYVSTAESLRRSTPLSAENLTSALELAIRLALRAYSGLLPRAADTAEDLQALSHLISAVPSRGSQAQLWAELALRQHFGGRTVQCSDTVRNCVRPVLSDLRLRDAASWASCVADIAPALYFAHTQTTLEEVGSLGAGLRDAACDRVCRSILRGVPPWEPYYRASESAYEVTHPQLVDLCTVLDLVDRDETIYSYVRRAAQTLASDYGRREFTREQRLDIAGRLARLVDRKLPDRRHIVHDGYVLVCQAQLARIRDEPALAFEALAARAGSTPNLSDQAYILAVIACAVPAKAAALRNELLARARGIIGQLPVSLDRAGRLAGMAGLCQTLDPEFAQGQLRPAMDAALQGDYASTSDIKLAIVDLAYLHSATLAASLASTGDQEPARIGRPAYLRKEVEALDLATQLANRGSSGMPSAVAPQDYAQACWRMLARLNAGRIGTCHVDQASEYLGAASELSLTEAYPILSWVTENCVRRHRGTDQARTTVREMFDGLRKTAEVCLRLTAHCPDPSRAAQSAERTEDGPREVYRPGDMARAVDYLRVWFAEAATEYIKIADPYFGPEELWVVQLIREANPTCDVRILTSEKRHKDLTPRWRQAYELHWRKEVSDTQQPPPTLVVVAGTAPHGEAPIHDRVIIGKGAALSVGGSLNGLGRKETMWVSPLAPEQAREREAELDRYLSQEVRLHGSAAVRYEAFTL